MIDFLMQLGIADPELQKAAVPGVFGFAGVVLTGIIAVTTWMLNQAALRSERRRAREERIQDLQLAIWAEILSIWLQCIAQSAAKLSTEDIEKRFQQAKRKRENYTPQVATPPKSVMFEKISGELVLYLEKEEIPEVIIFYRHLQNLDNFATDLRNPNYAKLSLDRKRDMLIHFINMGTLLRSYAEECLKVFEKKLSLSPSHTMAKILEDHGREAPSTQ